MCLYGERGKLWADRGFSVDLSRIMVSSVAELSIAGCGVEDQMSRGTLLVTPHCLAQNNLDGPHRALFIIEKTEWMKVNMCFYLTWRH